MNFWMLWGNKVQQQIITPTDIGALSILGGVLLDILPVITSVLTLVWVAIRLYELVTGNKFNKFYQKWRKRNGKTKR